MCLIDSRVEGREQRETASKCLHVYTVEATSRTHVYTERLWSEALRTASRAGGGWGELVHICCAVCLRTHSSSRGPNSPVTYRGHYLCTPHHMDSPLIARANIISYAQPTYYIHTAVYARTPRPVCRAHYMCTDCDICRGPMQSSALGQGVAGH